MKNRKDRKTNVFIGELELIQMSVALTKCVIDKHFPYPRMIEAT